MPSPHKRSFAAEELKRRQQKKPWLRIIARVVVVLIVIGLVYTVIQRYQVKVEPVKKETAPEQEQIKSIAVLPLDNLSGDPGQDYFSDGMHDALISNLSTISALRIISRTSVLKYKETTMSITEIARELDVDSVVEGTVLRADNKVRITVQVIATNPERHLWAKEYIRDLGDIISLQGEVARAIVDEINVALAPDEKKQLAASLSVDSEAYDYFLRGEEYYRRSRNRDDMKTALQMYQKAVEHDPGFAQAYTRISHVYSSLYLYHHDRSEECSNNAREAAEKALKLNSELPDAHLALGNYYYRCHLDYDRALEEFEIARRKQPNNSELIASIGYVQRRKGNLEEALSNIEKAFNLDPRSHLLASELGTTYRRLRRYPEAERYCNKAISLAPDEIINYYYKSYLYLIWKGNTREARAVLDEMPKTLLQSPRNIRFSNILKLNLYDGKYSDELSRLDKITEGTDTQYFFIPKALYYADIYRHMNDMVRARAYYDSAQTILEEKIRENPGDARFHSSLARVYAGQGKKKDAIREGERMILLHPLEKEYLGGLERLQDLAHIYTMVGEYDKAINQIEYLLTHPSDVTVPLLTIDPDLAPLHDHPLFKALLKRIGLP